METPLNPQRSQLRASFSADIDEVESTGAVLDDETETVGTKEAGEEEEVTGTVDVKVDVEVEVVGIDDGITTGGLA